MTKISFSQDCKFPDSNASWLIREYTNFHGVRWHYYSINGDTVINNIKYNKLDLNGYYRGGIRADTNCNIYFYGDVSHDYCWGPTYEQEYFLYNFNIGINDSLIFNNSMSCYYNDSVRVVTQIDSILLNNKYYKRYYLSSSTWLDPYWIENIGSYHGPLGPYRPLFENVIDLCYFIDNSDTLEISPGCHPLMVEENNKNVYFQVLPNPVEEISYLTARINSKNLRILMYNMNGSLIRSYNNNFPIAINRNDYPSGLYYFILLDNNKKVASTSVLIK